MGHCTIHTPQLFTLQPQGLQNLTAKVVGMPCITNSHSAALWRRSRVMAAHFDHKLPPYSSCNLTIAPPSPPNLPTHCLEGQQVSGTQPGETAPSRGSWPPLQSGRVRLPQGSWEDQHKVCQTVDSRAPQACIHQPPTPQWPQGSWESSLSFLTFTSSPPTPHWPSRSS